MKKYKVKGIEIEDSIADELTKMLSEQLTKEIDKEILKSLGVYERNIRRKNSIQKIFNV